MTIVATKETFLPTKRDEMIFDVAQIIEAAVVSDVEVEPCELAEQIVNAISCEAPVTSSTLLR